MSNPIVLFRFLYRAITTLTTLMMTRKVLITTLTALMIAMMVLMILENLNWRSTKNILVLTTLKFLLTVIPTLFRYSEFPYVLIITRICQSSSLYIVQHLHICVIHKCQFYKFIRYSPIIVIKSY